ncbi:MAG: hypothetical protein IKY64_04230 [Bacteroidaceae bacterium]|nr:hypothetical protein [Bacteroidaceae bacterium]
MNEVLQRATQLLQDGEPEQALLVLDELEEISEESKHLKIVCKKSLSEQYIWLLNDAVKNNRYDEFDKYLNRYLHLIGNDELIAKFVDVQDEIHKKRDLKNKQELVRRIKSIPFQLLQKVKSNKRFFALGSGVVLLLIVILVCLTSGGENAYTDVAKKELKGNVKYVAVYSYSLELQDGELVEEPMEFENERGVFDYSESYYNVEGMLEKYRVIWDTYMNTDTYIYEKGLLKEIKHTFNDRRHPEVTRFTYNDKKRLVEKSENSNGSVSRTSYAYDARGYMISDGEYEYTYDRKGRLKKKYSQHYKEEIFSYDKSGNVKNYLIEFSDPTGLYEDSNTEYNIIYDRQGRIVEKREKDRTNDCYTVEKYTYEDDEKGNWIVQNTFVDGELSYRTRRNIEYYDEEEHLNVYEKLVKGYYEAGMPCRPLLFNPEVKDYIVNTKSQKFYDLAIKYTDESVIFQRDAWGGYYANAVSEEDGFGTKISMKNYLDIELYVVGQQTNSRGEFDILPWEKGYVDNYNGPADGNTPVYLLTYPFHYYSDSGQSIIENVEIRIDQYGLRFICPSFSYYPYVTFRVTRSYGGQWSIPVNHSKQVVHIGWDNDKIYELLEIISTETTIISIDCISSGGNKRTYFADFSGMGNTRLVVLEFMYEAGAIKSIKNNSN